MEQDIVFYPTMIDGESHTVVVDLAIHNYLEDYPHGVVLMIPFQLMDDGSQNPADFERIQTIQDNLIDSMHANQSIFMGSISGQGSIDIFFASASAKDIEAALVDHDLQEIKVAMMPDGALKLYMDNLYPNLYEQQVIVNQEYCQELLAQGETFEAPRDVIFQAAFHNNEQAHAFTHAFGSLTKEAHLSLAKDNHVHVQLTMHIIPDIMSINEITKQMIHITESNHGHFEGWVTSVVSGDTTH